MKIILQSYFLLLWGIAVTVSAFITTNHNNPSRHQLQQQEQKGLAIHRLTSLFASSGYEGTVHSSRRPNRRRRKIHKDVVIVGGGLAGLSAALYLSQIDPDRNICILDKHELFSDKDKKTSVATFAAAGMLAPQSERLPKGDYLNLCLESKKMFPDFADLVECMAQESGEEGMPYLSSSDDCNNLEPWNIGYVASGGFLAPAFAGDTVATWAPPEDTKGTARWLDETQVRELEPHLHPDVVGGWWFPEDASVDARRLAASLRAACVGAGIQLLSGKNYEVSSLDLEDGHCNGLWLKNGKYFQTKTLLVANGAWMRNLLPVPIEPHKGQSLSLRMPLDRPPLLRRVLFAADSYIVPKADGRIVIGATVEAGSFSPSVTPAGIMHILSYALQLVPGLADLPLEETWAGLRPTTPDKGPILGKTPWDNLYLAGGYWRNGVLLAPKTGELMALLMAGEELSDEDEQFLEAFAWDRFTSKEGGATMAANARYAASMYPVHSRKSGVGVAAAVGTELGSYSTAVSAQAERKRDRDSMFGDGGMDAFERAASMGKADGSAFSFGHEIPAVKQDEGGDISVTDSVVESTQDESEMPEVVKPNPQAVESKDLESIYRSIRDNKSKQHVELEEPSNEEIADPGFRIFHIDEEGTHREVPPHTAPADFLSSLEGAQIGEEPVNGTNDSISGSEAETNSETFDGYQTIVNAAAEDTDIQKTMRAARLKNRISYDDDKDDFVFPDLPEINSQAGEVSNSVQQAATSEEPVAEIAAEESAQNEGSLSPLADLSDVYQQIREQKAGASLERNEASPDERPDPGFRIFHIDEFGTEREVPPYTEPGAFLESIQSVSLQATTGAAKSSPPSAVTGQEDTTSSSNTVKPEAKRDSEYSEETYDGYQDIIKANASSSREDELKAMKEARRQNRIGQEPVNIDEESLGQQTTTKSAEKGLFL